MDPGERVCPFCGEPPGPGVFCAACGRNLTDVHRLPTRGDWERRAGPASGGDALAGFLTAMHAAGDPGVTRMPRAEPGFLGRTLHAHGWVVRAARLDADAPAGDYEPGRFVTVDGHVHRVTLASRGAGQRDGVRHVELVGPQVTAAGDDERLAGDLAAVLQAHGLGPGPQA